MVKFIVTRTSRGLFHEEKPCEEAQAELYSAGSISKLRWVVYLETLEELMDFTDKYNRIIVESSVGEELPTIEIYDDYRD